MKKITIAALIITALSGCQASDEEIRADIATKARKDLNFAALNYTVNNGVVNISGNCPSRKALATVKQTIKNINVIKAVRYNVVIAPVKLDSLTNIKLQADSVLAKYPQVTALVTPNGVTLKGPVDAAKRAALIQDARLKITNNFIDSVTVIPN